MPAFFSDKRNLLLCFLIPLLVFWIGAILVYPTFSHNLMPDSISYMTIARRYLQGDYVNAINGYWSPLNIWLLVAFVKLTHIAIEQAAYIVNCISFTGFIFISIRLAARFLERRWILMFLGITLSFFALLNIPVSLFADVLSSFFILLSIYILTKDNFLTKGYLWIAWSFVFVLAAYSKVYALYILPLILLVWLFYLFIISKDKKIFFQAIRIVSTVAGFAALFLLPWIYLLHQKYGVWMFSSAGKINSSWSIIGHTTFSENARILVAPAIKRGLTYWEDPWFNHGQLVSSFQSLGYFKSQLYRFVMNIFGWIQCVNIYSPFYLFLWLGGVIYILRIKKPGNPLSILVIAYVLFPLGYWLIAVHTRYLLVTVPILMIFGFLFLEKYSAYMNNLTRNILIFIFCASWMPGSIVEAKSMWGEGKDDLKLAQQLTSMGVRGSFIANTFNNYPASFRLSWYTSNAFYAHPGGDDCNTACLLKEATRLHVRYYFYYYQGAGDDYQLYDSDHKAYAEVTSGQIPGLKIFDIGGHSY